MKRSAVDHPKTIMLAHEIEKVYASHRRKSAFGGKAEAIGLLEMLWDWSSKYAIHGNIGKWPDDVIAEGIGWTFSGKELISCLISSGWIDETADKNRLVIHDIQDHATNLWRQNLKNAGLKWWDGSDPRRWNLQKKSKTLKEKSNSCPEGEGEGEGEYIYPLTPTPDGEGDGVGFSLNAPGPDATKPPKKTADLTPEQEAWFEEFWASYTRREDKKPARRAFAARVKTAAVWEKVKGALARKASGMDRPEVDKRKLPATWLNAEPWNEEPSPQVTVATPEPPKSQYQEWRPDPRFPRVKRG